MAAQGHYWRTYQNTWIPAKFSISVQLLSELKWQMLRSCTLQLGCEFLVLGWNGCTEKTGWELNVSKGPDHSCDFENHSYLYSLRTEKHLVIISLWSVSLKGASVELKFHVLVLLCNSVENDQLLFCPPPQKTKFPVQGVLCFDFIIFFSSDTEVSWLTCTGKANTKLQLRAWCLSWKLTQVY